MTTNTKDLLLTRTEEILKNNSSDISLNLALSCGYMALQYKGENLKLFNPKMKSPLADYVLIITASNTTQASAMAEMILTFLKKQKIAYKIEGMETGQWVLIDIQNVLVHIFLPETRELYNLDLLYASIAKVQIPEDFYSQKFLTVESTTTNKNSNYQDYF